MLFAEELLTPHDHLIVAVSGGIDSMVLLHILFTIAAEKELTLTIAHFNHQIRGEAALRDADFVQNYAQEKKLPCIIGMKDVPTYAEEHGLSLEDAARICRYQFLKKTAQETGATKIVLAHNHDDQTETIIMRFLRGTGSKGLCGMAETRLFENIPLIRPLLNTPRTEIEAYAQTHNIPYQHDETNDETVFMRNKLRHDIIPRLQEINPNLKETMSRMAAIFQDEERYWESVATATYDTLRISQTAHEIKLDTQSLLAHPKALQRRVIRKAIESLQGSLNTISLLYIENFLDNKLNTLYMNDQGNIQGKKS